MRDGDCVGIGVAGSRNRVVAGYIPAHVRHRSAEARPVYLQEKVVDLLERIVGKAHVQDGGKSRLETPGIGSLGGLHDESRLYPAVGDALITEGERRDSDWCLNRWSPRVEARNKADITIIILSAPRCMDQAGPTQT